jgi:hydroxymethylbilane synthase
MSQKKLRIGTRDSQLAVWQATLVQNLLKENGVESELVYIKSEGDIDTVTPLYELGVQGVFTKSLDAALLDKRIDIAVHSMKDVPTQLAKGIIQAAVLKRANHKDLFVPHPHLQDVESIFGGEKINAVVATSSVRRIAQWKHRFPHHTIENLRGNVNTRLRKLKESNWHGAIFAAAGLERIGLRPDNAIELDWMLPAPAQGAIMVVCREDDTQSFNTLQSFNDPDTALCTKIERDFLRTLMGGCSTPISAFAEIKGNEVYFNYNITSVEGLGIAGGECSGFQINNAIDLGIKTAENVLAKNGDAIDKIRKTGPAT